jgi:hypothetical protein
MTIIVYHLFIFVTYAITSSTAIWKTKIPMSSLLVGCYHDTVARDFEIEITTASKGNVTDCLIQCQRYRFAALQKRDECWCSNKFGRFGQYPTGCTMPCEDGEACGGKWANSVYVTNPIKAYRGCLLSKGQSPIQKLAANLPTTSLTFAKCLQMCIGYSHLGIEAGRRCWCFKSINHYVVLPSAKCDVFCGDSMQCGGSRSISVYDSIQPTDRSHRISVADLKACYKNPRTSRYFSVVKAYSKNLTVSRCQLACYDYNYMGVEEGQKCWCDNMLEDADLLPDTMCSEKCIDGNSCGAKWVISVYSITRLIYVACLKESPAMKIFIKQPISSNNTNLNECYRQCGNYKFLAMKSASECYCGNITDLTHFSQGECTMICQGDGYPCGDHDTYSLYGFRRMWQDKKPKVKPRSTDSYYLMKVKEESQIQSGLIDVADGNEYIVIVPKNNLNYGEKAEELSPYGKGNEEKTLDPKEYDVRKAIDDSGFSDTI